MPEKELVNFIKTEKNSDVLYIVALACIERLTQLNKPGVIKAIVDSGTTTLLKIINSK